MGYVDYSAADLKSYAEAHITGRTSVSGTNGLFSATKMADDMNPKNIVIRESRDSENHPNSTPIIIALDVTGSMGPVLRSVVENLNTLMTEIYERKPVSDPQICFMAVGDAACGDKAPLQVSQFESDIRIAECLQKIYFEKRGGSNESESYTLPWYFALNYVSADAIEKHHRKGILFTMGDETLPSVLTANEIKKVFGSSMQEGDIPTEQLLNAVSRDWEVFHLVIEQGNFYSGRYIDHNGPQRIEETWGAMLGQNVIYVDDYNKIAEIIVSVLEAMAGKSIDAICDSWDGSTAISVRKAIGGLTTTDVDDSGEIIDF